jgi:hypothetical protein
LLKLFFEHCDASLRLNIGVANLHYYADTPRLLRVRRKRPSTATKPNAS